MTQTEIAEVKGILSFFNIDFDFCHKEKKFTIPIESIGYAFPACQEKDALDKIKNIIEVETKNPVRFSKDHKNLSVF